LGQPFLFFRGKTQTLWIEHLEFTSLSVGRELLDTAYRWARDKHLQCVIVENSVEALDCVEGWPQAHVLESKWIEIRSSRSF